LPVRTIHHRDTENTEKNREKQEKDAVS